MNQRPFSKLKKQIDSLFVPALKMEVCCYSYPTRTQFGNSSIPRFCIKLFSSKEIIWDCPKNISVPQRHIHDWSENNHITEIIREYIDTPVDKLLNACFEKEVWQRTDTFGNKFKATYGLTDLFKAADRRIGGIRLMDWARFSGNNAVFLILARRFGKSDKVPAKKSVDGVKYVVLNSLPEDQQIAWRTGKPNRYLAMVYDGEPEEEFCPYYHDYENFYNNWVVGRDAFHLV